MRADAHSSARPLFSFSNAGNGLAFAALLIHVGLEQGVFAVPQFADMTHIIEARDPGKLWQFLATLLSITFSLQTVLIPFNLLPLPPLDGSAFPLFFLSGNAAEKYQELMWNPTTRLVGMIIAWQTFGALYGPIFHYSLHLLYPHAY